MFRRRILTSIAASVTLVGAGCAAFVEGDREEEPEREAPEDRVDADADPIDAAPEALQATVEDMDGVGWEMDTEQEAYDDSVGIGFVEDDDRDRLQKANVTTRVFDNSERGAMVRSSVIVFDDAVSAARFLDEVTEDEREEELLIPVDVGAEAYNISFMQPTMIVRERNVVAELASVQWGVPDSEDDVVDHMVGPNIRELAETMVERWLAHAG